MKKIISAVLSASLAVSSMGVLYASATEVYGDSSDIVIFGDSIAEGYDLAENESNYGQIIADYTSSSVSNYAKAGDETSDTLTKISSVSDLAGADVVIISSGANDMIHYSTRYILKFFAQNNLLNDGYTADNLPDNPTFDKMMDMVNITAVKEYVSKVSNQAVLNLTINKLEANLTMVEGDQGYQKYDRVIETQVIPNISKMVSDIKAVNPDARIIVQTIYNPVQLDKSYLNDKVPSSYRQFIELLMPVFDNVITAYNNQLKAVEGIEIADVYSTFDAGYERTWYFTGFQEADVKEFKIHPNSAGHLAIAVNILNLLGENNEEGGLLNLTYDKLASKDLYPASALAEYLKIAGKYVLGDINGDALIDSRDATLILSEYSSDSSGAGSTLSNSEKKSADINHNGKIDATDASAILSYYSYVSMGGTKSFKYFLANE